MSSLTMRQQRGADGFVRHIPADTSAPPAKKGRKKRVPPDPIKTDQSAGAEQLRLFIERIERLEEEKQGIADDIRDVYAEAKGTGFDQKGMRAVVQLRKMEKHHRDENDAILETYRNALGLA